MSPHRGQSTHLGKATDPSNAGERDEARPVVVQLPLVQGQQRGWSGGGRHEQCAAGPQQGVQVLANLFPGPSHRLVLHSEMFGAGVIAGKSRSRSGHGLCCTAAAPHQLLTHVLAVGKLIPA